MGEIHGFLKFGSCPRVSIATPASFKLPRFGDSHFGKLLDTDFTPSKLGQGRAVHSLRSKVCRCLSASRSLILGTSDGLHSFLPPEFLCWQSQRTALKQSQGMA